MKTIPEISGVLRQSLQRSGQTQQAVREAAGVSRQTFSNVMGGQEDYKLSTLLAVADRLGLELMLVPKAMGQVLQAPAEGPVLSLVDSALQRLKTRGA